MERIISEELYQELLKYFGEQEADKNKWQIYSALLKAKTNNVKESVVITQEQIDAWRKAD